MTLSARSDSVRGHSSYRPVHPSILDLSDLFQPASDRPTPRYQPASAAIFDDFDDEEEDSPSDGLTEEKECCVCLETKDACDFPDHAITRACEHSPSTCNNCIEASISSDLNNKLWTEVSCPECGAILDYHNIQELADDATKERYQTLAVRGVLAQDENFIWCTAGCGNGQCHEGGVAQPIVICNSCDHRSCYRHNVAWHDSLTCDEYDALQENPENFRSQFELDNEEAEHTQSLRRLQEDTDRLFVQRLQEDEQQQFDEAQRLREQRKRQEREARERSAREEARRKADEARALAARRKREDDASQRTVARTSKPCPKCGWAIEKTGGCSHMTCIRCKHAFCYECLVDHKQVLARDNSVHKRECKYHPKNLRD